MPLAEVVGLDDVEALPVGDPVGLPVDGSWPGADDFGALFMATRALPAVGLRPTAVAIHNDGNVARHARRIESSGLHRSSS